MLIQHKQAGNKGMFFVAGDDNILAEMIYTKASPIKVIIDHTKVSEELREKNVAYELVHTTAEYARTHNIKIIPLCPFANPIIKKNPEFADILFNY